MGDEIFCPFNYFQSKGCAEFPFPRSLVVDHVDDEVRNADNGGVADWLICPLKTNAPMRIDSRLFAGPRDWNFVE